LYHCPINRQPLIEDRFFHCLCHFHFHIEQDVVFKLYVCSGTSFTSASLRRREVSLDWAARPGPFLPPGFGLTRTHEVNGGERTRSVVYSPCPKKLAPILSLWKLINLHMSNCCVVHVAHEATRKGMQIMEDIVVLITPCGRGVQFSKTLSLDKVQS
jgi:hypothetical protein